jgi:hypothetical protein
MYTRKAKRGGVFGFGSKNSVSSSTNVLKMKRNYNLKHSKSRVANVLGAPGQIRYTNKERIESEYQKVSSLYYKGQPSFDALLKRIREHIKAL